MMFSFSTDGLQASVRGAQLRRDGSISATIIFSYLDEVVFSHVTNWSDAVERAGVAQVLAERTSLEVGALERELANLERALAGNLTSADSLFKSGGEVGSLVRHSAAELKAAGLDPNRQTLQFLDVLGQDRLVIRGFSHLFSGYPKAGKTTTLAQLSGNWATLGERVLYLTEEPRLAWEERLKELPGAWERVNVVFALGADLRAEFLAVLAAGDETVVIIDTVRLLRLQDENNNSEVNLALTPLIALCRERGQTLILSHHTKKAGGEFGVAAAGGHAFLGIVDVGLELMRDPNVPERRRLRGWGRIVEVPELLFEKQGNLLLPLGDPRSVALESLKEQIKDHVTDAWKTTEAVRMSLPEPRPSSDNVGKALEFLARAGAVDRDPPVGEGPKQGKTYRWRSPNLNSAL